MLILCIQKLQQDTINMALIRYILHFKISFMYLLKMRKYDEILNFPQPLYIISPPNVEMLVRSFDLNILSSRTPDLILGEKTYKIFKRSWITNHFSLSSLFWSGAEECLLLAIFWQLKFLQTLFRTVIEHIFGPPC